MPESIASIRDGSDEQSIRFLFGKDAKHVPMWMYVQGGSGDPLVTFVGSSETPRQPKGRSWSNPLNYGSDRTHKFILGELVVRPHLVIATDSLRGMGLSGLATGGHDLRAMLEEGEMLLGIPSVVDRLREQGELP